jgi:sugar O-acyltransferase (sialic acid O-acetyltransferase NeuD family)
VSTKSGDLVIVGAGEFAEIAYEYFTHDSPLRVVGFAVERAYLQRNELFGLPVVAFEEIEQHFPTATHQAFVAITNTQLNRVRARLFHATRAKGYRLATYVSSRAFVWHNVQLGENCFIFENNVVQYHVQVGDNVIMWSGNHVGHRTRIVDHTFLTSHVVISGYCEVGRNCYFGVNASVADHIQIGEDCVIGMGAVVVRPTDAGMVYIGSPAKPLKSSYDAFQVAREAE